VIDAETSHAPGHLIRRAHQIHDMLFAQETAGYDITSPQLAAMRAIALNPGLEQTALSEIIAYDSSTIGGLIDRLEAKGLVQRTVGKRDRRKRELTLTPRGHKVLTKVMPPASRVADRLLEPLSPAEREQLIEMLQRITGVSGERRNETETAVA
jgi:DNA-binding MarR family transcriptional regulator